MVQLLIWYQLIWGICIFIEEDRLSTIKILTIHFVCNSINSKQFQMVWEGKLFYFHLFVFHFVLLYTPSIMCTVQHLPFHFYLNICMLSISNFRGMAVCVVLMFGRLGSIVGSNVVGAILEVNCSATFYLYSIFIIGNFPNFIFVLLQQINIIVIFQDVP